MTIGHTEAGIGRVEDQGIDVACLRNLHGKIDDRLVVVAAKKHHPRHEVDGIACSGIGGSVQTTAHFGGVRGIDAGAGWSFMGEERKPE